MATAPAVSRPGWAWHGRGTWSARKDRVASAVWLGLLWVGMIAGFGVDFPRYLRENPPAPLIVHIHGAVFSVWMFLLTAQVLLVLKDRVAFHMKLGWFLAGWACLMAVLGPWAAMESKVVDVAEQAASAPFISVHIVDMVGFLVLLGWGLTLRKNPAAHKRLMILSTVSLADPGYNRLIEWIHPTEPNSAPDWFLWVFYGNVVIIALMLGWDWWRGRVMKQAVIGGVALLAAEYVAALLYFWEPWRVMTLH